MTVVGIDACRAGWVAIALDDDGVRGAALEATVAGVLAALEPFGPVERVGIDIPIGGIEGRRRACDDLARARLGPRRSSVFAAPDPRVLDAATHAEANARSRALTGRGLSAQAWHLVPRIREVAALIDDGGVDPAEVHPELSFRELAGAPLDRPKTTWAGIRLRERLLATDGIVVPDDLGPAGAAGVDDVLDAAAVAWTARRWARGTSWLLPDPPERDGAGRPVAIRV